MRLPKPVPAGGDTAGPPLSSHPNVSTYDVQFSPNLTRPCGTDRAPLFERVGQKLMQDQRKVLRHLRTQNQSWRA